MNTNIPEQEFVIDYNISEVKQAISLFIGDLSLQPDGYYKNSDTTNDMFNTYGFNIWKTDFYAGSVTGDMRVTLHEAGEKKTKVSIQSLAKTQGPLDNSRMLDIQSDFLKKLGAALKGEYIPKQTNAGLETGGCFGVVLIIVFATILAFFITI